MIERLPWLWLPKRPLSFAGWYPCCGSPCANCSSTPPDDFEVVIAGIQDQDCATCDADLNDTYICSRIADVGTVCIWEYVDIDREWCSQTQANTCWGFRMQVWVGSIGGYYIQVNIETGNNPSSGCGVTLLHRWEKDTGVTKIDCGNLSSYSLPLLYDFDSDCDSSTGPATCLVSAA